MFGNAESFQQNEKKSPDFFFLGGGGGQKLGWCPNLFVWGCCFHREAKLSELNFVMKNLSFFWIVKLGEQNYPHSWSICLLPPTPTWLL